VVGEEANRERQEEEEEEGWGGADIWS